jgi:uncharacterized protein (TIGR03435 family)
MTSSSGRLLRFGIVTLLMTIVSTVTLAQTPAPLSFEVASIKPAEPITQAKITSGNFHFGMFVEGLRVDIGYSSLAELIPIAFNVKSHQVSGPDWMGTQRFDILAKMPEGTTKEQVPEMLQALLVERFQLKIHRENREQNVYALVVGKGGPRLKDAPPDAEEPAGDPSRAPITFGAGNNQFRIRTAANGATVESGQAGTTKMSMGAEGQMRIEMSKVSMPAFATALTRFLDRPVVDMTELKGNYQVALDIPLQPIFNNARAAGLGIPAGGLRGEPGRPVEATEPSGGGSIFASVQQLGLRLDSRKAPIETVVIDHVEKMPTEN